MKTQKRRSSSMRNFIESFRVELSLSKSEKTVEAYYGDIKKFVEYLRKKRIKEIKDVKHLHCVGYLVHSKALGLSEATVNRYFMSIRSFCKYLRKNKLIEDNFVEYVTVPKVSKAVTRVPTIEEVERILCQPDLEEEDGVRDRAMLELLYSSGLRASELCNLRVEDVGPTSVRVVSGKRDKTRTVPITEEAWTCIAKYIGRYRLRESGYLFKTIQGKKMSRLSLCKLVRRYAKSAGVERVTTHTLRHACATHLLDGGANLRVIQEILGHSSIASTERYTYLSSVQLQSVFHQFHPRKRKEING